MTKAEAEFRAMAFRIVYDGVYATVDDLTTRFACAIAYSARAINDGRLFESWWAWTRGRSIKGLLASGNEPPAELRPFVDSYLLAVGERARETGDTLHDLI
jgi:hypothetical protein